jgi:hypothetical protein
MKLLIASSSLAVVVVLVVGVACLTTYNRPKFTAQDGAPAVEPRPEGCHVDVFDDGTKVDRPHKELGRVVLDWPQSKLKEQGPEGAYRTLKASACENGAFIVKDVRALSTGAVESGLVYEATLATLLGEDGEPLNARRPDAGPIAPALDKAAAAAAEVEGAARAVDPPKAPARGGW